METTYKAEDELGSTPERTSEPEESEAESFEVEDPYDEPQYNSTSPREETNIGAIRMALMSVVNQDNINYQVKLAVTHQLEETLDEKAIKTLVEEPKKEAMGGTKKNPKENQKGPKGKGKPEPTQTPIFDMKLHMSRNAGKHPANRTPSAKRTLTAHVKIAGVKAYMLFDSRAETDAISPDYIWAVHIPILQLENPVLLQMGTKGTRSQIIYGMNVDIEINGHVQTHYFNVVNIDKYEVILEAPWLNENKALLDFESHVVKTRGKGSIKTLTFDEDQATKSHGWKTWAK